MTISAYAQSIISELKDFSARSFEYDEDDPEATGWSILFTDNELSGLIEYLRNLGLDRDSICDTTLVACLRCRRHRTRLRVVE